MWPTGSAPGSRLSIRRKTVWSTVLRVVGVAGDAVSGTEYHGMVLAEDLFEVRRGQVSRFGGCSHQRFHPIRLFQ